MREQLLKAGVRNLKEFGYPNVDEKNILTDYVFSAFFKTMLEDTMRDRKDNVRSECESLLKEIAANT